MRGPRNSERVNNESSFGEVSKPVVDQQLVDFIISSKAASNRLRPTYKTVAPKPSDTQVYLRQERTNAIAERYSINRLTSEVLAGRGHVPGLELETFLNPQNTPLPYGNEIRGVCEALEIITHDIREKKLVTFIGDYDVDGVTSLAQAARVMSSLGAKFSASSPCRLTEGYGLSEAAVRKAHAAGTSTIVCLDIGSSNSAALNLANSLGMKTVVIDHHPSGELNTLPATAVINPHQSGCGYEGGRLCASALTHLWLRELSSEFNRKDLDNLLPLAGFATIADVVPLIGMNRTIASKALELTPNSKIPGIIALCEILKSRGANIESQDIAYSIAPILNAVGRMLENGAEIALKLLTTDDLEEARILAHQCIDANISRKKIEAQMIEDVANEVERYSTLPEVIVLQSENFHPGVVGLTAARTVERYGRPAIIFHRKSDGTLVGSGRSLPRFNLKSLLDECAQPDSNLLLRYGGHQVAIGCTIKLENFERFRLLLNHNAEQRGKLPKHEASFDQELSLKRYAKDQATINLDLKILSPTGKDNEPAAFMARNIKVVAAYRIGARHTMVILKEGKKDATIVAGYIWHNPDHPTVIAEGATSFSPGHPPRLPIHSGCKINIVYRPMRLEGKDVLTGKATAKIEILGLSPC